MCWSGGTLMPRSARPRRPSPSRCLRLRIAGDKRAGSRLVSRRAIATESASLAFVAGMELLPEWLVDPLTLAAAVAAAVWFVLTQLRGGGS